MPLILSTIMAPTIGFEINSQRFNPQLPISEAKYIDDRIKLYNFI
jgi:hypothetical protein